MEFSLKKLPKSEIEIEVAIPFSEFEPHVKRAAILISEETEIEGFRKGKAPYDIVKNKFGEHAIYERAAELAVKKTYPEILRQVTSDKGQETRKFIPIGRPEIIVTKLASGNELQYKAKIALLPEVKLADYKSIAVRVKKEKKEVSVSDEEVEKTLKWVRESRVPRPDYESGRDPGRSGDLGTTGEGEGRKVPELTDEFAKGLGDFPTVDALKSNVRDGLKSEKEEREKERIRVRILEEIAKDSGIEVPDVLVEAELEKMFTELKSGVEGMGMKWEDYLMHINPVKSQTPGASADPQADRTSNGVKKLEETLRDSWRDDALKRVRAGLVLREIAKMEKIEPSAEEIETRAGQFLSQYKSAKDTDKKIDPVRSRTSGMSADAQAHRTSNGIDVESFREYTKGILRNEKVFEFLESI